MTVKRAWESTSVLAPTGVGSAGGMELGWLIPFPSLSPLPVHFLSEQELPSCSV